MLCFISLCSCFAMGAFSPLLPEIGGGALADWQLGVVAGALGFGRMATAIPAGWLAGRYLGTTLWAAPALMLAGTVLLAASSSFAVLVLARLILGCAFTVGTVSGLYALLLDDQEPGASVRLNTFEFSAMIGVLGGLGLVGLLPGHWGWSLSLLVASSPLLLILAAAPAIRRRFPDASRMPATRNSPTSDTIRGDRMSGTLWTMFTVGIVLALAWSAVSQFLLPLRATREFGLDRSGVSSLLMLAQLVDIVALLPVGRLADGLGRTPVLGFVIVVLGLGTAAIGLGSFPWFVVGCACFGFGLAGWMLPVGVIREHTRAEYLAWRMGLYRVGVDAAMFFGPFASGLLGEENAGIFVTAVGGVALVVGGRLLLTPIGRRAASTK